MIAKDASYSALGGVEYAPYSHPLSMQTEQTKPPKGNRHG
jgi:hypothetical protein